jgi:hypothetical protein
LDCYHDIIRLFIDQVAKNILWQINNETNMAFLSLIAEQSDPTENIPSNILIQDRIGLDFLESPDENIDSGEDGEVDRACYWWQSPWWFWWCWWSFCWKMLSF